MTHRPDDGARDESYVDLSPDDPDWDLSEEAGYGNWEPGPSFPWVKWLIVGLALLLVASLALPLLWRASRFF
jgi:hypothetical protein